MSRIAKNEYIEHTNHNRTYKNYTNVYLLLQKEKPETP